MSDYILNQCKTHEIVNADFAIGKNVAYYEVQGDNDIYGVMIKTSCTCAFAGTQGIANNKLCSHVIKVMQENGKKGEWVK